MLIKEKLKRLRQLMEKYGLDAYLIPGSDPHQSEYPAEYWKDRQWISGFSGSAGIAIVTRNHAGLWTDSRYFIQATKQLEGSEFVLHKQYTRQPEEYLGWLLANLDEGAIVGIDGNILSIEHYRKYRQMFEPAHIKVNIEHQLLKHIWDERPALPEEKAFDHPVKFAGLSRAEKLLKTRTAMSESGASYLVLSTLDEIAWTFNLRGMDIKYFPVPMCFALVGSERSWLFIDLLKVSASLEEMLRQDQIALHPYDDFPVALNEIVQASDTVMIDPAQTSTLVMQLFEDSKVIFQEVPSKSLKAVKNQTETTWIRQAMIVDGIALVKHQVWLRNVLRDKPVSEFDTGHKIAQFRSENKYYQQESFSPIVGFNSNGAIVHYSAPENGSAEIDGPNGVLLIDCGAQYEIGTTDITRTWCFGQPTAEQKKRYTQVLKGHIAVSKAVFPEGTRGIQLDTLARQYLWADGVDYGHGTGHGVGYFLNVHETPHGISPGLHERGTSVLEKGVTVTNEPGYYKEGAFGIRIENMLLVIPYSGPGEGNFLQFETLTLFPIDKELIEVNDLSEGEKDWLNQYHLMVFDRLSPFLEGEELSWLEERCSPIN
jgi:Xaa-Pro aminopeptidase